MLWINKYTALLRSNKGKIVTTIFHRLQGYLGTYIKYFLFLFTLVKFGIYPCDVTDSCITNLHTNLGYLGLAKITVTQDETWFLFFKEAR